MKIFVFIAYNILTPENSTSWLLLKAIRSYTLIDQYLALDVHTENTIQDGQQEFKIFGHIMQVCWLFFYFKFT
jgi:hypothetical protein